MKRSVLKFILPGAVALVIAGVQEAKAVLITDPGVVGTVWAPDDFNVENWFAGSGSHADPC